MGWWKLKPETDIDPYKALCVDPDNILDFVILNLADGHEISDIDKEHIYDCVKGGYYQGAVNDWDGE